MNITEATAFCAKASSIFDEWVTQKYEQQKATEKIAELECKLGELVATTRKTLGEERAFTTFHVFLSDIKQVYDIIICVLC